MPFKPELQKVIDQISANDPDKASFYAQLAMEQDEARARRYTLANPLMVLLLVMLLTIAVLWLITLLPDAEWVSVVRFIAQMPLIITGFWYAFHSD